MWLFEGKPLRTASPSSGPARVADKLLRNILRARPTRATTEGGFAMALKHEPWRWPQACPLASQSVATAAVVAMPLKMKVLSTGTYCCVSSFTASCATTAPMVAATT